VDSVILQPGGYATGIFEDRPVPANAACRASYGAAAELEQIQRANMDALFEHPHTRDFQPIANAILKLISTPVGERPLRTVVDTFLGPAVEAMNSLLAQLTSQMLPAMGMPDVGQTHKR
jgi:hypothetical protein